MPIAAAASAITPMEARALLAPVVPHLVASYRRMHRQQQAEMREERALKEARTWFGFGLGLGFGFGFGFGFG